ncbi:hypothetical protein BS47DRAFT_1268293, partial [Hydnum rufescens UP504]
FHVQLNWLLMMLRTYRGSSVDNGTLSKYIDLLGLKRLNNAKPDHHLLECLILQVYEGQIQACWIQVCGFESLEAFAASKPSLEKL